MQDFEYRAFTFYGGAFQHASSISFTLDDGPQPRFGFPIRFGLFPVRSPLLGESRLITFPPVT
jgi:hypothetical protein